MAVIKIKLDADNLYKCEMEMATAIIGTVLAELRKSNLSDDQLKDFVTGIALNVCCILDASQPFGNAADDIFPVLTFQAEGHADDEVTSCGGPSYMHEYVLGLVAEQFNQKPEPGSNS